MVIRHRRHLGDRLADSIASRSCTSCSSAAEASFFFDMGLKSFMNAMYHILTSTDSHHTMVHKKISPPSPPRFFDYLNTLIRYLQGIPLI
ncbi:hypothetical protein GDO81_003952 [Engystomops pustulosus]|uniref:Uncharacterized protein n=1 Tax=Engystomops pustulosus TaxID=76066 RepID=A0AAV7A5D0_ENGPU|nr:hypothetical protein GDO81_003952 [Engystomops pustulosus]